MKVYTHPNIVMPAGTIVVKFYDFADSGTEALPACIKEIGDVEEGFEINFGDYYSPECSFLLHNNSSDTIYDILVNNDLFVSVVIDNSDLYFYGYVDKQSIEPSENYKNEISFEAVHAFASLSNYKIEDFETDILSIADGPVGYDRVRAYLRFIAKHCKLKNFIADDIVFNLSRLYLWWNSPNYIEFNIDDVLINKDCWRQTIITNRYEKIFTNAFEILNALKNDFFFYPSVIYDGSDFKLKIIEKDFYGSNWITLPIVKSESEDLSFANKSLLVDAKDRPDEIASTDIKFEAEDATLYDASEISVQHIHTNVADAATHNVFIYIPDSVSADNYAVPVELVSYHNGASYQSKTSFHEAMFETIKTMHFNYEKGLVLKLHGLKGTISSTSKIEYLSPGYRFIKNGKDHYIHTISRSLMRNETTAKCLVQG